MKWSALSLIALMVLTLLCLPANACNYGAATIQRSFYAAPTVGYSYGYAPAAPALLPAPTYAPGNCGCGVAAAPLPSYAPVGDAGCGVAAAPLPSYGYGGVVAAQRTVVAGYAPSFAPVATPYYSAGVGYNAGFAVVRQRAFYASPARGFGVGFTPGYAAGGVVVAGRNRGVVVGGGGGVIVAGRSAGVIVGSPGVVEVRRGLFGRTQVRFR